MRAPHSAYPRHFKKTEEMKTKKEETLPYTAPFWVCGYSKCKSFSFELCAFCVCFVLSVHVHNLCCFWHEISFRWNPWYCVLLACYKLKHTMHIRHQAICYDETGLQTNGRVFLSAQLSLYNVVENKIAFFYLLPSCNTHFWAMSSELYMLVGGRSTYCT